MIDNGASTEELLRTARTCLDGLERSVKTRRRMDKASDLLTDLFIVIEHVGRRLRLIEWDERVAAEDDDEDASEPRREVSLHELMIMGEEVDDAPLDDDVPALHSRIRELEDRCTGMFRGVIRYTTRGCSTAEQVTKKWLALIRRVAPDSLQDLGTSQTAVARTLGERRATTSAREKREFELPMRLCGARGYRGGAGGLRSEQNRENCAKAQRGNSNRAKGHAAGRGDEFQEQRRTSAGGQQRKSKHKTTRS